MKTESTRKKFFSILTLIVFAQLASLQSFAADIPAKTIIHSVKIEYSRMLYPVNAQGFEINQAIIGGHVHFEGKPEVNVTLKIGGQVYTAPTDPHGNFSFFVFANYAGRFEIGAWSPNSDAYVTSGSKEIKPQ
jgi:hypothetical protein